jgi:hypothetical protein
VGFGGGASGSTGKWNVRSEELGWEKGCGLETMISGFSEICNLCCKKPCHFSVFGHVASPFVDLTDVLSQHLPSSYFHTYNVSK